MTRVVPTPRCRQRTPRIRATVRDRGSEDPFPLLEELDIGVVAYSPLARGFLSGAAQPKDHYTADDFRQFSGWWQPENFDKNVALVAKLDEFAGERGISLTQLSLAWILAQRSHIVPIPGSKHSDRVQENIAAAEVMLSPEDIARIRDLIPDGAHGPRFIS